MNITSGVSAKGGVAKSTTAKMIEKHGFEVVTAHKGEKSVKIVEKNPEISRIMMDIDLGKGIDAYWKRSCFAAAPLFSVRAYK